jgi:hypothetical protein
MMAELKTQRNDGDVHAFLAGVPDEAVRRDAERMVGLMRTAARAEPVMWGSNIVGFGSYHYIYASGREGDWFLIGFAPRKKNLTLYLMGALKANAALLKKLGKHKAEGSCLHIKSLEDVHLPALKLLLKESVRLMKAQDKRNKKK